jgi:hypothetical protein
MPDSHPARLWGGALNRRRILILAGAFAAAILLAFLLRRFVEEFILLPLARLFWLAGMLYHAIPQLVYWVLALAILISLTIGSFAIRSPGEQRRRRTGYFRYGEIQQLSFWFTRSRRSLYSKWHLANLLANTALDILQRRSGSGLRPGRLEGPGWNPPREVQEYLSAALTAKYSDFAGRGFFSRRPHTPFDRDIEPVIAYLESFLEDAHDHQHS